MNTQTQEAAVAAPQAARAGDAALSAAIVQVLGRLRPQGAGEAVPLVIPAEVAQAFALHYFVLATMADDVSNFVSPGRDVCFRAMIDDASSDVHAFQAAKSAWLERLDAGARADLASS